MVDETRSHGTSAFAGIGFVVAFGLALSFFLRDPTQPKHPDRVQVRMWHMWTAEWREVVEKIVDRYNESQDTYEVVPLSVPPGGGANAKFLLAVAGNDPPDMMVQWYPVIPKWADSGLLMPLNDPKSGMMTEQEWADFQANAYPIAKKIGMYKGNLYGVTVGLNIWACYYRLDHLKEKRLDPKNFPDTLQGLMAWGKKLHKRDGQHNLTRLGFLPQWFHMYVTGFNGGFYDWQENKLTLDRPENLRALTFLVDARKKLGFENVSRFESGLRRGFGVEWPFIGGHYSITTDGQWRVVQLAKYAPDLKYGTAPIPPPEGGKKLFGWSNGNFMIVPKGAKNPRGAWEFIKFWSGLSNPERAAEFYTWGGWLPLSDAIAHAPKYREYVRKHPQFQTFLDILPSENVHPTPPVPYQDYLWDRFQRTDESAVRGTLTPKQALDRLVREIETERARRRELGYGE